MATATLTATDRAERAAILEETLRQLPPKPLS